MVCLFNAPAMRIACWPARPPMAALNGDTPPCSFKIGTAARAGSVSSGRQPVVSCQRVPAGACCVCVTAELRRWLCFDVWL